MATKKPPASKKAGRAPVGVKKTGPGIAPAKDALDALGLDGVCARICDGDTMTGIAQSLGITFGSLSTWLEASPERSARTREARALAARQWDEQALTKIENASDAFELSKAKEVAHHLRWRATKIAPAYSDRQAVELTGKDGGPIQTEALTPEARRVRMDELAQQLGARLEWSGE